MIWNENEYKEAAQRLADERKRLKEDGLSAAEIKWVIDPMESFHPQLGVAHHLW